jgi:hypothetical protein
MNGGGSPRWEEGKKEMGSAGIRRGRGWQGLRRRRTHTH